MHIVNSNKPSTKHGFIWKIHIVSSVSPSTKHGFIWKIHITSSVSPNLYGVSCTCSWRPSPPVRRE